MNSEASEDDDLRSLKYSKTLSTSIEDDKHRRQVDAAKKRAAAQHVDYPSFAAMVSAAHLEPVDRKSLVLPRMAEKNVPAWSFNYAGILPKPKPIQTLETDSQVKEPVSKENVFQSPAGEVRGSSSHGFVEDST